MNRGVMLLLWVPLLIVSADASLNDLWEAFSSETESFEELSIRATHSLNRLNSERRKAIDLVWRACFVRARNLLDNNCPWFTLAHIGSELTVDSTLSILSKLEPYAGLDERELQALADDWTAEAAKSRIASSIYAWRLRKDVKMAREAGNQLLITLEQIIELHKTGEPVVESTDESSMMRHSEWEARLGQLFDLYSNYKDSMRNYEDLSVHI